MNILKLSLVVSPLLMITLSNFSLPAANAQNSGNFSFTENNNRESIYSQNSGNRPFGGNNNRDDDNSQNSGNRSFGGNNNNTGNNGQNSGNRPKIFCRLRPGVWVLCKLLQQQQQQNSPTENTTPDTNSKRPALNRMRN